MNQKRKPRAQRKKVEDFTIEDWSGRVARVVGTYITGEINLRQLANVLGYIVRKLQYALHPEKEETLKNQKRKRERYKRTENDYTVNDWVGMPLIFVGQYIQGHIDLRELVAHLECTVYKLEQILSTSEK